VEAAGIRKAEKENSCPGQTRHSYVCSINVQCRCSNCVVVEVGEWQKGAVCWHSAKAGQAGKRVSTKAWHVGRAGGRPVVWCEARACVRVCSGKGCEETANAACACSGKLATKRQQKTRQVGKYRPRWKQMFSLAGVKAQGSVGVG